MITLRHSTPVSRKERVCEFCGGIMPIGQRYSRQTNIYDGIIYDWCCHIECGEVASLLSMYDDCGDEGLDCDSFRYYIDEYVYENHYDEEIDDISKDWQLTYYETVLKIKDKFKDEKI